MGAGAGARPRALQKPDKDRLNAESLFAEWRKLQRRHKLLRDVRLELTSKKGDVDAYFMSDNVVAGPGGFPDQVSLGPTVRLFLPSLRETHEASSGFPRFRGARQTATGRDLTKYAKSVLRHEAAHALNRLAVKDRPVLPREATEKSRLFQVGADVEFPASAHMKNFQLLNRMLGGAAQEPSFSNIGLPPDLARRVLENMGAVQGSPGIQ